MKLHASQLPQLASGSPPVTSRTELLDWIWKPWTATAEKPHFYKFRSSDFRLEYSSLAASSTITEATLALTGVSDRDRGNESVSEMLYAGTSTEDEDSQLDHAHCSQTEGNLVEGKVLQSASPANQIRRYETCWHIQRTHIM